jgi:hypothetical protein
MFALCTLNSLTQTPASTYVDGKIFIFRPFNFMQHVKEIFNTKSVLLVEI